MHQFIEGIEALKHVVVILLLIALIVIGFEEVCYGDGEIVIGSAVELGAEIVLQIQVVALYGVLEEREHLED